MHARDGDWYFQFRYGLPLILPLLAAVGYLLSRSRWWRMGTLAILLISLVYCGPRIARVLRSNYPGVSPQAHALAQWTAAQPTPPILFSTHPSNLSAATGGYFHHWVCWDPIDQVRAILKHGRVTHVLVYPQDRACEAFNALLPELDLRETMGDWTLFAVR
jgi:hypothetical protein